MPTTACTIAAATPALIAETRAAIENGADVEFLPGSHPQEEAVVANGLILGYIAFGTDYEGDDDYTAIAVQADGSVITVGYSYDFEHALHCVVEAFTAGGEK